MAALFHELPNSLFTVNTIIRSCDAFIPKATGRSLVFPLFPFSCFRISFFSQLDLCSSFFVSPIHLPCIVFCHFMSLVILFISLYFFVLPSSLSYSSATFAFSFLFSLFISFFSSCLFPLFPSFSLFFILLP